MQNKRRHFIKYSLATCASAVFPKQLLAFSASPSAEEIANKKSAQHIMTFASPYDSLQSSFIPHMHQEFKKNIEGMSQGRIFVEISDNGQLGVGTELMAKVSRDYVSAALISVSNLSPALPILDTLNIPFWSAENQQYVNLVSSDIWEKLVLDKIKQRGKLEVLFHYIPGARTITTTKTYNKIVKKPSDLDDVIFRVPASEMLTQFYSMTKANVINVPWSEVARLSQNGRIQALDPSTVGLYAGPDNLKSHIGTVSTISSVQDAWVAVVNQTWLKTLPVELKIIVKEASELTFQQHIQSVEQTQQNCFNALKQLGVKIYQPYGDEQQVWVEQFGHQRSEWNAAKKQLLGDIRTFKQLLEATEQTSKYLLS